MELVKQSNLILGQPPNSYHDTLKLIEKVGRICYQSTDKITDSSAKRFVEKQLVPTGHHAMLEHSWLVLRTKIREEEGNVRTWLDTLGSFASNFLKVKPRGDYLYVYGNWRAFLDLRSENIAEFARQFPEMPKIILNRRGRYVIVEQQLIPKDMRAYTVVFKTDRAVTHELVRHRPASYAQKSQRYCADKDYLEFIIPYMFDDEKLADKHTYNQYLDWTNACERAEESYHRLLKSGMKPQEARAVLPNSVLTEIAVTASIEEWEHIFNLRCALDAYPQIRRLMIPVLNHFTLMNWTERKYPKYFYTI